MAKKKNPAAVALGRLGGKTVTEKKRAHLRHIARTVAGRKPKFVPGARVVGRDIAVAAFRGRTGTIVARTKNRNEYLVRFDASRSFPACEVAARSWWLEAK